MEISLALITLVAAHLRPVFSLLNACLLVWLGCTVLWNSSRRHSGIWLAGLSLCSAGLFFAVYSPVFGAYYIEQNYQSFLLLSIWYGGMITVALSPLAWSAIVLFFLRRQDHGIPRKYILQFIVIVLVFMGMAIAALWPGNLPDWRTVFVEQSLFDAGVRTYTIAGFLFLTYLFLSAGFSLLALLSPNPQPHGFPDVARAQARPALLGAAWTLFSMCVCIMITMGWFLWRRFTHPGEPYGRDMWIMLQLDAVVSMLIAIAVLFIGRAIISYEVFSGDLPRRSVLRQWRLVVRFAFVVAILAPILQILFRFSITAAHIWSLLAILFFAWTGHRQVQDERRYRRRLRPFLGSQNLYTAAVSSSRDREGGRQDRFADVRLFFADVCRDTLNARTAMLVPLGSVLIQDEILTYPETTDTITFRPTGALLDRLRKGDRLFYSLDPEKYAGAVLAIPLRSRVSTQQGGEEELAGIFLMGPRDGGGVYTQEEVDTARAAGERILDNLAAAALANLLLTLQQERLIENRLLDEKTRRVLHDDVLPELHTLMLHIAGQGTADRNYIIKELSRLHQRVSSVLRDAPVALHPDIQELGLVGALRQVVSEDSFPRSEADRLDSSAFDQVVWSVDADAEQAARELFPAVADVLFYAAREAIRNAAAYARRADRELVLRISIQSDDGYRITIEDNGGVQNTFSRGTGQGLALHSAMMSVIGGWLRLESRPDQFTRVRLFAPVTGSRVV